ncbi:hypothetical protein LCGC14_0451490 [marine sediment metagenome]|uniref:Clp R domain-containing protein n=1 Tax=marine sediment metagenome TaxID=412755 RepID=A0A0F9V4H5_9ZZZZ|nr:hypothetical protein [Phycisphaerae bacterium]HDZ42781.1 hypothetical protein [Phycisphaerae bacterium]
MFERFTQRARKVMALANQEAHRFNHEYIGTEHILLGLIKEGTGVGANVLRNLDVDLHKVRVAVEQQTPPGPEMVATGKLPMTPRAEKVIEYATPEARNLNHNYIGTEHLLLGLLCEGEGIAAIVLTEFDLKLDQIREEVQSLLGAGLDIDTDDTAVESERPSPVEVAELVKTPEASEFVGQLIADLAKREDKRLSDIYLTFGRRVRVQYRIGNYVDEFDAPAKQQVPAIIAQLKQLFFMSPARSDIPQEGRMENVGEEKLTLRATVIPTDTGEVIAIHVES